MAAATKYPHSRFMDPRDPERGESPPPKSVTPPPREEKADQVAIKVRSGIDEDFYKERDLKRVAARWGLAPLADAKLSPGGRRRKTKKTRKHTRKHRRSTRRRA